MPIRLIDSNEEFTAEELEQLNAVEGVDDFVTF